MPLTFQTGPLPPRRRRHYGPAAEAPPPPVDGHHVLGVVLVEEGGWVRWDFDGPIASTGETGGGMVVGGQPPAGVRFTVGDSFVMCLYAGAPAAGTPWHFTGPASEVTFEDGRPGVAGSGVCSGE
jgi:hypothetical protein